MDETKKPDDKHLSAPVTKAGGNPEVHKPEDVAPVKAKRNTKWVHPTHPGHSQPDKELPMIEVDA